MKLSTFKEHLQWVEYPIFQLWDWSLVPPHYHVTEIWVVTKKFIDCGGTMRVESLVSFQLWYSDDIEHRLSSEKLLGIIALFEEKISDEEYTVEVEYQWETIGKYWIMWLDNVFILTPKQTDCLAKDACGIPPAQKQQKTCCGWGCC